MYMHSTDLYSDFSNKPILNSNSIIPFYTCLTRTYVIFLTFPRTHQQYHKNKINSDKYYQIHYILSL